jgi:hypothetical protein
MTLRLGGWKLRIDPRLRLQHFMPSNRLQWMYLRGLQGHYSPSDVVLDAYSKHSLSLGPGFRRWLSERWYQFGKSVRRMASRLSRPSAVTAALLSIAEGGTRSSKSNSSSAGLWDCCNSESSTASCGAK